ncbi:protein shisa-9A [Scleropages formosus]|uniref:Shisa family member 9a n=1 Tax=Scleropages formosus TaxID=113540 RepID=A0A8C9RM97_SCLFO|nr:protein shisa-9 [Scleropages formosus]
MILAAPALFPARLLAFFLSLSVLRNAEGGERRMASGRLLLGYFLVKVLAWGCTAGGEPGQQLDGFLLVPGSNGSREADGSLPHTEDRCRGYYDVMGQWDPPFVCKTGNYLYCCGTCGFRFCCAFESSRLDQSTCKNYDTPIWMMTGQTPYKKNDPRHDPTKDKTNLIVYIICGVVAIMALVGIFTKLGLEKAHRPQRENMSRALASVMNQQGPCPGEHEDTLGMHHYENIQARTTANNLQGVQVNSVGAGSPLLPTMTQPHTYPALGQLTHTYEQPQPVKELNKYASLKAVAEKANDDFYSKRRHLAELAAKGSLPLHPVRLDHSPSSPYSPEVPAPCPKQNGHKSKGSKAHVSHPLAYSCNTIASPGVLKGWNGTESMDRRKAHGPRKHCTVEQVNELHAARSQPFQPYFVTNSKTEVTV